MLFESALKKKTYSRYIQTVADPGFVEMADQKAGLGAAFSALVGPIKAGPEAFSFWKFLNTLLAILAILDIP